MTLKKKQASEKKKGNFERVVISGEFWVLRWMNGAEYTGEFLGSNAALLLRWGMGVYPILYTFIAILSVLTEWLVYLFIQQIYLYIESLVCDRHVWGSENRRMNKVVMGPTFSEGVYCERVHSGGNKQTGNDV